MLCFFSIIEAVGNLCFIWSFVIHFYTYCRFLAAFMVIFSCSFLVKFLYVSYYAS